MTSFVEFSDAGYHWATHAGGWLLLVVLISAAIVLIVVGLEKITDKIPDGLVVAAVLVGLAGIYGGGIAAIVFGIIGVIGQPGLDAQHLMLVAEACGYSDVRYLEGVNIFSAVDPQGDQVTIQVTEVRDEQYAVTEIPR